MLKFFKNLLKNRPEIILDKNNLSQAEIDYKNNTIQEIYELSESSISKDPKVWAELKQEISNEANQQILIARNLGVTPQALANKRTEIINAELEQKRSIMRNGYSLTIDDHLSIILPLYKNIDFIPDPDVVVFSGRKVIDILYEASSSDYYISKGAHDELIGFCDSHAVVEFSKEMRKNYETARRAKDAGYLKLRLVTYRKRCQNVKA